MTLKGYGTALEGDEKVLNTSGSMLPAGDGEELKGDRSVRRLKARRDPQRKS